MTTPETPRTTRRTRQTSKEVQAQHEEKEGAALDEKASTSAPPVSTHNRNWDVSSFGPLQTHHHRLPVQAATLLDTPPAISRSSPPQGAIDHHHPSTQNDSEVPRSPANRYRSRSEILRPRSLIFGALPAHPDLPTPPLPRSENPQTRTITGVPSPVRQPQALLQSAPQAQTGGKCLLSCSQGPRTLR